MPRRTRLEATMKLNPRRRRMAALGLALAVSLAVVAPAAAKGPIFPHRCPERVEVATQAQSYTWGVCGKEDTASAAGDGFSATDAAILAGSVSLLVMVIAGGMLVTTHRREAHGGQPAAVGRAGVDRG